jgi:hypothetical protein
VLQKPDRDRFGGGVLKILVFADSDEQEDADFEVVEIEKRLGEEGRVIAVYIYTLKERTSFPEYFFILYPSNFNY